MKIEKVSLSRTIPTGPYMNDKIGMEATLEPGENESDALHALSGRIEKWHKENAAHLYQESSTAVYSVPNGVTPGAEPIATYKYRPEVIGIISKDHEKIEIAIDNAETADDLKKIKAHYEFLPASLINHYNKRLQELTTGRPQNFTDGLE